MESGASFYEGLTTADKARIANEMSQKVSSTAEGTEWSQFVARAVDEIVTRRAAHNEPLDHASVVAELVPLIRAHLPQSVREAAFRYIAQMGDL